MYSSAASRCERFPAVSCALLSGGVAVALKTPGGYRHPPGEERAGNQRKPVEAAGNRSRLAA
eukprot:10114180-Alexandrium_andersonii.AAC.1